MMRPLLAICTHSSRMLRPPEWIDDNFVGMVFQDLTQLDNDPLLDCAHGFITGKSPVQTKSQ